MVLNYFEYSRNVIRNWCFVSIIIPPFSMTRKFHSRFVKTTWLFGYCNTNIKGKCRVKRDAAYGKFLGEHVRGLSVSQLTHSCVPFGILYKSNEMDGIKNWTFESKIKLLCCTRCCWKILDVKTYLKKNPRIITRLFQLSSFCSSFSWACLFPDWSSWPKHNCSQLWHHLLHPHLEINHLAVCQDLQPFYQSIKKHHPLVHYAFIAALLRGAGCDFCLAENLNNTVML